LISIWGFCWAYVWMNFLVDCGSCNWILTFYLLINSTDIKIVRSISSTQKMVKNRTIIVNVFPITNRKTKSLITGIHHNKLSNFIGKIHLFFIQFFCELLYSIFYWIKRDRNTCYSRFLWLIEKVDFDGLL
jgi:hypothetical protein